MYPVKQLAALLQKHFVRLFAILFISVYRYSCSSACTYRNQNLTRMRRLPHRLDAVSLDTLTFTSYLSPYISLGSPCCSRKRKQNQSQIICIPVGIYVLSILSVHMSIHLSICLRSFLSARLCVASTCRHAYSSRCLSGRVSVLDLVVYYWYKIMCLNAPWALGQRTSDQRPDIAEDLVANVLPQGEVFGRHRRAVAPRLHPPRNQHAHGKRRQLKNSSIRVNKRKQKNTATDNNKTTATNISKQ